MKQKYSIRQLRKHLDITARTIRYYEEIGILKGVKRNKAGSRLYSDWHINQIETIKKMKTSGLSLKQIMSFNAS